MELFTPILPEAANSLAMALVMSSQAPLLLLNENLTVMRASGSFCDAFGLDCDVIVGKKLNDLGSGEWGARQLRSLLFATIAGDADIHAYEMDLVRPGHETRCVLLNAHRLDYFDAEHVLIALAVTDITDARAAAKLKDDLVREKQVLLQELQHRVANSLQIIASVLMQSARRVQSEETRGHLRDAHHRVMSIAALQKQLAASKLGEVELRLYFTDLCRSIGASMISNHDRLTLAATVDESVVSADISVSLGLIVTELVINALKHAFPGRNQAGAITVEYASHGSSWSLMVGDDGVGIPVGDGSKPGLGTGIVDALAKQLGGTVTITDRAPGTLVSITHP
ncbi:histidine kinase dimerization/phosphoacceptor domain -containing protein [Sphingomonas bacterium]|uniref:sensor histidine kinase n=1 Tax=Sphingomonas bacterium TaxID=1895847 RepID=UPI002623A968|nr:histidine kinase dimerization/phosphoacceptor domain -containing protein [Sphingomonas bacterium]MDB5678753.1 Blue-light-activated histidine kinase 2 [Sphingomonas bacterium]